MKVETQNTNESFKPVRVTFICETQEELDRLGALTNCSELDAFLPGNLWENLEEAGANVERFSEELDDLLKDSDEDE